MTGTPHGQLPRDLAARLFRAQYSEFGLRTIGGTHVARIRARFAQLHGEREQIEAQLAVLHRRHPEGPPPASWTPAGDGYDDTADEDPEAAGSVEHLFESPIAGSMLRRADGPLGSSALLRWRTWERSGWARRDGPTGR